MFKALAIKPVGDFILPNLEAARECIHPIKIYVRWMNAYMPFACGHCASCKARMSRQKTEVDRTWVQVQR